MTREQVGEELLNVIRLIDSFYKVFNFKYHVELSTRPDDFMGEISEWDAAEQDLRTAIESIGKEYVVNEGDGAFYGPKLDFHLEDSLGRTWQCGTIQLDFQMPQRFGMSYIGSDGEKHTPIMIHRAIMGSVERFIGMLTEHFAGKFPLWLAPVQVKLMTVTDANVDYAEQVREKCEAAGLRVETDYRNEKIGYKIREARNARNSYMCVIGEKEAEEKSLSVRSSKAGDLGSMSVDDFVAKLVEEVETKAL